MGKLLLSLGALFLVGCVYVGQSERGPDSFAVAQSPDTRLAGLLEGSGESGHALVITDATLALTSRLDLIAASEQSLDVQYFIWQNDPSGILVIDRLLAAADRGVRVRALVDDVQLEGLVSKIDTIGEHPNIEVRIFNPFSLRVGVPLRLFRLAEFAIDGNRLNHRMHNKLLIADNQLAILGGRNIGDDYFGMSLERNFADTDLLLSGKIVPGLSDGFDRYWNSGWAVSTDDLLHIELEVDDLASLHDRIRTRLSEFPELIEMVEPDRIEILTNALLDAHLLDAAVPVVDDPDVSWGEKPDEIADELTRLALSAEREILIVSPYLVLTPTLLELGQIMNSRGVRVAVITNSLASNDVVIAHAAYARFRDAILASGAELFEYRGDPEMMQNDPAESFSLHSKYIIFDEKTVFLGSLNLDPRSLYLNTELGVILQSESLAKELRADFADLTSGANAWQVTRTNSGFAWRSSSGTINRQPAKSSWQRFRSWLMMFLPLTSQI